jgi:hypothetical protein
MTYITHNLVTPYVYQFLSMMSLTGIPYPVHNYRYIYNYDDNNLILIPFNYHNNVVNSTTISTYIGYTGAYGTLSIGASVLILDMSHFMFNADLYVNFTTTFFTTSSSSLNMIGFK